MLQIIWLILKTAGILLLVFLLLLFFLISVILFVPLHYGAEGNFSDKRLRGSGRVSWLWGALSLSVSCGGETAVRFTIFGFSPGQGKRKAKKRKRQKKKKGPRGQKRLAPDVDGGVSDDGPTAQEDRPELPPPGPPGGSVNDHGERSGEGQGFFENGEGEPGGISGKVRAFLKKLSGLRGRFEALGGRLRSLLKQKEALDVFLSDEENRRLARLALRCVKRLLRHTLPRRVSGRVRFGLEDPYNTGRILEALAVLYPLWGGRLSVEPVFDEIVLEAEGNFKGRIRAVHFLTAAGRILLNKRVRVLIKNYIR